MTASLATVPEPDSLPLANARHERFCHEYLIDHNGTAAYLRVGYKSSAAAAAVSASSLLRNPKIAARVAYLEAQRLEQIGMTADAVLRELEVLGTSDIRHYKFTDTPEGIALAENAPDVAMRAVQSVRRKVRTIDREDGQRETVEEVEFRLWSKPAALRMAGEAHRLYVQKREDVTPPVVPEAPELERERLARSVALLVRLGFLQIPREVLVSGRELRKAKEAK